MSLATTGTPGGHRLQDRVGLPFVAAGRPEDVEVRHESRHVVAMPEEVDLVANLHLVAEPLQPAAMRPVAEDQQVDVVADDFQQVGRPDGVLHPFLRPQPPDQADQAAVLGQAQLGEDLPAGAAAWRRPAATPLGMTRIFSAGSPCSMQKSPHAGTVRRHARVQSRPMRRSTASSGQPFQRSTHALADDHPPQAARPAPPRSRRRWPRTSQVWTRSG